MNSLLTDETGQALLSEIRALRQELAEGRRDARPAISRADRKALETFVPALRSAFGTELFLSVEVKRHTSPTLRAVTKRRSTKAIGKLLKRAVGVEIGGLIVECQGSESGATLWRVSTSLLSKVSFGFKPA